MAARASVRQAAHNGSGPCKECGRTTCAALSAARFARNVIQSGVKNGMSQLKIKFHTQSGWSSCEWSKAVTIPPNGPSPGQRSSTIVTPNSAYFPGAATTFTSSVTPRIKSIIRASIGFPANSTSDLSRPNRVLPPPAKTYAIICGASRRPASQITSHPSRFTLFERLAPRAPDSQLAQFFLQALPVQPDRRRRLRYIPTMFHQLLRNVGDLKLSLCLAKILLAKSIFIGSAKTRARRRLPAHHFLRQVHDIDFLAAAKHYTTLQRILQFADISR